jgi:hypothetical protein
MKGISERHRYTDQVLDKMRSKGIKPTHLRGYFSKTSIERFVRYEAPFVTIEAIEAIVNDMFTKTDRSRNVNKEKL